MARFRRIVGLSRALRRCGNAGDLGAARRWELREALRRYARAVPSLSRLAEGLGS